jgi:hypothetical protein
MVAAFVDNSDGDSSIVALIGIFSFVPFVTLLVVASDQVVLRGRRMVLVVFVTFGDNTVGGSLVGVPLIGMVPFVPFVTLFVVAAANAPPDVSFEIWIVTLLLDNTSRVLLLVLLLDPVMDPS